MTLHTGEAVRLAARNGTLTTPTCSLAPGYLQANLVIVPREYAFEFLLFCTRNPKPCPVLEVTDPGNPEPVCTAPGADLRTDVPSYRVFRDGVPEKDRGDIVDLWRDDFVSFLLGCSFSFESEMIRRGLPVRHIEQGTNVPMYRTSIACQSAGMFNGSMVVSMRPMTRQQSIEAVCLTTPFTQAHGSPVYSGDPAGIGIGDIDSPDYGDAVEIRPDEIPVFWACGVTPQAVLTNAKLPLAITHSPGCMFVTDQLA